MRLFIAVNIKAETKNKIAHIQSVLKKNCNDVKWIETENLHLTLKFLGEVDEHRKNLISEKLRQAPLDKILYLMGQAIIGIKKFEIYFEKIGVFPSESFPRVLWLGVGEGKVELENLAQKIENLFTEIDFEREKRSFSAHLTLGKFKSSQKSREEISGIIGKMLSEKISDIVEAVYLMKSILTPRGPIYEVVEKFQMEEK
ncbi:MAG: 2'-5' RNA ligase [Elusimicrobia bacterium A5]|nr:MAG: 2'-5' RNA ligase [Elusimicrobia bacterium A5]